jgi:ATP-dependent protease Clp ATPase subunit
MKSFLNNVFALCSDNPVLVPVIALPVFLILKKRTSFSETGSSFSQTQDSYVQYSTGDPVSSAPHTPDWFRKNFDEKVAGQEDVKEVLSVLAARFHRLTFEDVESNVTAPRIFLGGPSGCGKTFLATVMAELTKNPSLVVDTSQLTAAGYVGKSVSEMLLPLKGRVNRGNGHKAVVVLDEFDKKASRETSGLDVGRTEVQTQVLTMLGGTSDATQFGIRTDSIFFIATGAFSKLREQYPVITPEILIQHGGMSPEVMGRFTHILILNPLSKEEYLSLLKMKSGPIEAAKKLFAAIGISVEIKDSVLEALANYFVCNPSCMNVRDLKNRVEKAFLPLEGLAYNGCCQKNITITDPDFFLR